MNQTAVNNFVESILAGSAEIQRITGGRVYAYESPQGANEYPFLFWKIISDNSLYDFISGVGEVWQAEIQVNAFARSYRAAVFLAEAVAAAFNSATPAGDILSSISNDMIPLFESSDSAYEVAVRVFVNHS